MPDRKQRISARWVKINVFFVALIVVMLLFVTLRELHIFSTSILYYENALLEYKTNEVTKEVHNRVDELNSIMDKSEENYHLELETIINDIDHFATQNTNILDDNATLDEKREVYIDTINNYDLFDKQHMFFAIDLQGLAWLSALDKSDEGTDIRHLQDALTGDFYIVDMINKIKSSDDGSAFHTYHYPKELGGEPKKKTSYIKYNDEVELFIGTGVYYEDYLVSVQQEFFNRLKNYYENSEKFIYLYGYDASPYVHKDPNLTKQQVLSVLDEDGEPLHYTFLEEFKKNHCYQFDYSYAGVNKTGVVHNIPEWEMYIGQSFEMNEIETLMNEYIRRHIPTFILSLFLLSVISVSFTFYIRQLMRKNFGEVQDEFEEQSNLVKKLSLTDSLTGLHNRKFFSYAYDEYVKTHPNYSFIMGDANGLKLTNDAFGHIEGDKLLVIISRLLEEVFEGDNIFRWGGDEFLIHSRLVDSDQIHRKIDLFNELSKTKSTLSVRVSVSFGYAIGNKDDDIYQLMKIAEDMMYEVKTNESSSQKRVIIDTILNTLYNSFDFEKGHSENVKNNALLIGKAMGFGVEDLERLRLGALLHDIGKITIPDNIITSTNKLSEGEYNEIKKHSEKGYRILQAFPQLSQYAQIVYHHHEKYDGTGYPLGLKAEQIPLLSRIIAVADAYDAMVEQRVYRQPFTQDQAIEELIRCKGTQFDPKIVDVFVKILQKKVV